MRREKKYYLKEITEDGLLKDAKNRWGDRISPFGMISEAEVWEELEGIAGRAWGDSKYKADVSYIVVCEYVVSHSD